jgi:hypothetical protein
MGIFAQLNPYVIIALTAGGLIGFFLAVMWADLCPFCDRS